MKRKLGFTCAVPKCQREATSTTAFCVPHTVIDATFFGICILVMVVAFVGCVVYLHTTHIDVRLHM